MSATLMNLSKIWDAFFFPVLDTVIAWFFFLMLLGRKKIIQLFSRLFHREGEKYCRRTYHIDENGKLVKSYTPINDSVLELMNKPLSLVVVVLLFCFSFYRIIMPLSNLFPVHISYTPSTILLRIYDHKSLAQIWAQYPALDLNSLITKIEYSQSAYNT